MMIKKYICILLLVLLFGCKDQLYEDINQYLVVDKEQEKIDLLSGIYSRLVRVHNYNYFRLLSRSDDVNFYTNYSFTVEGQGSCSSTGGSSVDASVIGEVYVNLYTAIINANYLLCELTSTEDQYYLGEVYFLRAYCYFKLARLFGRPPLVLDTDVNYLLPKPSYAEVYQLIESDLLEAIDLLPETYSLARVPMETPHVGTAKALLAEVYLAMAGYPVNDESKYAGAASLAGEVMENAEYYGIEFIPDLADLTTKSDQHCNEQLFTLFMKQDENNYGSQINNLHASYFHNDGGISLSGSYKMEIKFFIDFPNNYRKRVFTTTGAYNYEQYSDLDTTFRIIRYQLMDPLVDPCTYVHNSFYLKWVVLDDFVENDNSWYSSQSSFVSTSLLRYAQTMLTYAEAKARSGQLDQLAYEAVNKIRRRANQLDSNLPSQFDLTPGLSTEQFLDSVLWERAWELCFEPEGRWFDIIRLNLKDKLKDYRYSFDFPSTVSKTLLTDDWYFYQIPQEDRWLNPNFE
ncbi:MAG: RagB/SusD family nutrient uptake outer membrane protein [Prolixibacteraceae bacterium]